ncbi:MAG: hypothetical protein PHU85_19325 [Phycisphaerae bacterium]|nr:hypothetical protein [Phycisphaerae bacterium]
MNADSMRPLLKRLSSRKFLTTLAVQIAGLAVLFAPGHAEAIASAAERIAAIVAMVLVALGYVNAESKLDAAPPESQ